MPEIVKISYINLGRWQHRLQIYKKAETTKKAISFKGFLHESEKSEFNEWLNPLSYVDIATLMLIILISVIIWYLWNQVRIRTAELQKEIQSRKQIEELDKECSADKINFGQC